MHSETKTDDFRHAEVIVLSNSGHLNKNLGELLYTPYLYNNSNGSSIFVIINSKEKSCNRI